MGRLLLINGGAAHATKVFNGADYEDMLLRVEQTFLSADDVWPGERVTSQSFDAIFAEQVASLKTMPDESISDPLLYIGQYVERLFELPATAEHHATILTA